MKAVNRCGGPLPMRTGKHATHGHQERSRVVMGMTPIAARGCASRHSQSSPELHKVGANTVPIPQMKTLRLTEDIATVMQLFSNRAGNYPQGCLNTGSFNYITPMCTVNQSPVSLTPMLTPTYTTKILRASLMSNIPACTGEKPPRAQGGDCPHGHAR